MGAPFEGAWSSVSGAAMYTGAGSSEMFWLIVSIVICVGAIWLGSRHESSSYDKAE